MSSVPTVPSFKEKIMTQCKNSVLAAIFRLGDEALETKKQSPDMFVAKEGPPIQETGNTGNSISQIHITEEVNAFPVCPKNWEQTGNRSGNRVVHTTPPPAVKPFPLPTELAPAPRIPAVAWPKPLPGEESAFGLPVRPCPACHRQMFWIRPEDPPTCVACGSHGAATQPGGGAQAE